MEENELTWKDIEDKIEQLGFTIDQKTIDGNLYLIDISDTLPYGVKESFLLQCNKDDPSSVIEAFHDILRDYNKDDFYSRHPLDLEQVMDKYGIEHLTMRLNDLLTQHQQWQETLSQAEDSLYLYVANAGKQYSKEEIGQKFLDTYESSYGSGEEKYEGDIIYRMGKTIMRTLENLDCGTVEKNKQMLSQYLKESGLTSKNQQVWKGSLRSLFKFRDLSGSQINTVKEGMSDTDRNIHLMFDNLYNNSKTNPIEFAQLVLSKGTEATERGLKGDKWWKEAILHAVNATDEWESSAELKSHLFKAFDIIKPSEINSDNFFEIADKKFAEYMYQYLKDLDVLDNKKRDILIKEHESKQFGRNY